jgi:hypothetical protein
MSHPEMYGNTHKTNTFAQERGLEEMDGECEVGQADTVRFDIVSVLFSWMMMMMMDNDGFGYGWRLHFDDRSPRVRQDWRNRPPVPVGLEERGLGSGPLEHMFKLLYVLLGASILCSGTSGKIPFR